MRESATIETNSAAYTDAVIRGLVNEAQRSVIEPLVIERRVGHLMQVLERTLATGNPYVRLHPRCVALEQVDIRKASTEPWEALTVALESEVQDWELAHRQSNYPEVYVERGNSLFLAPPARASGVKLRCKQVMRPPQIVQEQTAGIVTDVDLVANTITVDVMPVNRITAATLAGSVTIDVLEADGIHEHALFHAPATVAGTVLTVSSSYSVARVAEGDIVRAAGQSEWPQFSESYHHIIADIAAVTICRRRSMDARVQQLITQATGALGRWQGQLAPRTKATNHMPLQHGWSDWGA